MADHTPALETQRPGSIRSVASNSSISSGVSLTRKSRTRTRSRSRALASPRPPDILPKSPTSVLPYLEGDVTEEPAPGFQQFQDDTLSTPPTPAHSHRSAQETVQSQPDDCLVTSQAIDSSPTNDRVEEGHTYQKLSRLLRQTSGIPIQPTAAQPQPPPSAFSRDPEFTGVTRDSVSTHASGLSSSVYPPSTSTAESAPYPQSMAEQEENYDISSYDPEVGEAQEYDGDDVSYRLRLLVNNNYFLPPAHSKPSAAYFAASDNNASKKPVKPPTPTFFDLFRGKSRSKPSTPTGTSPGYDPSGPTLRTAADSITTAHLLRPQQPRTSSQIHRDPPAGAFTGRVVVVREKMQDLAAAAKQAEQDMKARGVRRDYDGQQTLNPVIDPTDAVDLPPPSSNYPFAVQASALHGLGVQESVGAALLADRLPPPRSPGVSSSFEQDEPWRKALLHQAVHHSLDSSSPDTSFSIRRSQSSSQQERTPQEPSLEPIPVKNPRLEQRIMSTSMLSDTTSASLVLHNSNQSVDSASTPKERPVPPSTLDASEPFDMPPLPTTPSSAHVPLMPAPRRHQTHPMHSPSPSDPPRPSSHGQSFLEDGSRHSSVRRTMSSPRLSDLSETEARHMVITPPLPTPTHSTVSFSELQETHASHQSEQGAADAYGIPRTSIATASIAGSRPSLSDYSQPSPTMSAFHTAPAELGSETSGLGQWRTSIDREGTVRDSPIPRYTATSPPPRQSSSLAHFALSPPPRTTSLSYQPKLSGPSLHPRIPESDTASQPSQPSEGPTAPLTDDTTLIIDAPEPTTPPFPIAERRGNPPGRQLSLNIPSNRIPAAIHSAPGPVSPTAFFDTIQAQPNAMDDLDSSSDESDDEVTHYSPPNLFRPDPRGRSMSVTPTNPRPSFMRLGNHSTPYISQSARSRQFPLEVKHRQPIANVPFRAPFFAKRTGKSDQGHEMPVSSFDFYKQAQQNQRDSAVFDDDQSNLASSSKRRSIGSIATWQSDPKAQEASKRLDGMLLQHMEAEKDTIKRIATTARSNIPVTRGY